MINHFRDQMPRPFIGIGHSMGGSHLVNVALMHPRLFESLILIDPVIQRFSSAQGNYQPAYASSIRRDRWPSRDEARKAFMRSKFYQTWDPRVLDQWITYGLRDLPTALYPDSQPSPTPLPATADPSTVPTAQPQKEVTLRTTKHNEVMTFLRYHPVEYDSSGRVTVDMTKKRLTHPDYDFHEHPAQPFYRPEPIMTFHNLPFLRPGVFYIFGSESHLSAPALRADKMSLTGIGVGGSGGVKEGRVKDVLIQKTGHLIPMEKVQETAQNIVTAIGEEMQRWRKNEEFYAEQWKQIPPGYENKLSPTYVRDLKADTLKKLEEAKANEQKKKDSQVDKAKL